MSLLDLPDHLKISITWHLDPESCFALALTCSELRACMRDLNLEHASLSAKYAVIEAGGAGPVLWNTFRDVEEDPRTGWYVKEINLPGNREDQRQAPIPDDEWHSLEKAAQALVPLYSPELVSKVQTALSLGNVNAIIILLVHRLPALETLRITDGQLQLFEEFLEEWADASTDCPLAHMLPFRRLKHASMAHWDTEYSCSFDLARYVFHAPIIETFSGKLMGGGRVSLRYWTPLMQGQVGCSLKELYFTCSTLDFDELEVILARTKALQSFAYDYGGAVVSDHSFHPRRIMAALLLYAGHSLRRLELTDYTDENTPINQRWRSDCDRDLNSVSLREFRQLHTLFCNFEWLQSTEGMTDVESSESGLDDKDTVELPDLDVRNILPRSLERLHLHGLFDDEDWALLRKTLTSPNTSRPILTLDNMRIIRRRPRDTIGSAPILAETKGRKLLDGHGE